MFKKSFLKKVAQLEKVPFQKFETLFNKKRIVIPYNNAGKVTRICAIGEGVKIKVNTNIGTSNYNPELQDELEKLSVAIKAGSHTIMDLSTGPGLIQIRKEIKKHCSVPLGTVPLYEIAQTVEETRGSFEKMTIKDILEVIEFQAKEGIDFFTIHAGITKDIFEELLQNKRVGGVVSRGGALLARWMYVNKKENPFYEHFDKILVIMKQYNVTMSLGDALRPGAIADSTDAAQIAELKNLSYLVKRCFSHQVQVMVEGPGHIKLNEIAANVLLQKQLCQGVPFYILGPLPIDIGAGYDHIVSAIGGALAGLHGADFLCVVTPAEHLRHPTKEDIKQGVIASRIAAHCVDVLRFKDEWKKDLSLSGFRAQRSWNKIFPLTIDPDKAREYRQSTDTDVNDLCSMCGKFCSLKIMDKCTIL